METFEANGVYARHITIKIRKQYAGIGMSYLPSADVFIGIQPFSSWTLDSNYDWQAPVERPADGNFIRGTNQIRFGFSLADCSPRYLLVSLI